MLRLNFDSASAAKELARDEAMLQWADSVVEQKSEGTTTELFRVWEFAKPTVVLGRSSKRQDEVDTAYCEEHSIEVLRRCTGGASVVGGAGCLMYSVVIAIPSDGGLRKIDVAHDYVMRRVLNAVQEQRPQARRMGTCDLTLNKRKFSGNSLRIARHHLLYHGTILLSADLDRIARCLDFAPRQPDYRQERDHRDFVTNIDLDACQFSEALMGQFGASANGSSLGRVIDSIEDIATNLMPMRYEDPSWHARH